MDAATAGSIPVGATLKSVRYHVPDTYTQGPGFNDYATALSHAIVQTAAAVVRHKDAYAADLGTSRFVPLPEHITIDVRWVLEYPKQPQGGASGLDFVAARDRYATVADAQESLNRRLKYTRHALI